MLQKINNKLDEWSKIAEPYIKFSIFTTLLASFITPTLFYLYMSYRNFLDNEYIYLGILMLLIPILLEVLLSLGIKQKIYAGLSFFILYIAIMIILVWRHQSPWLIAFSLVFLGYLISYILIKGILIFTKELKEIFIETKNVATLIGQIMIPVLTTAIPIAIALAIKYLFNI
ncbi:hypothetical protein LTY59_06825 [Limosilactobacillus balticus]|uniref:Uncharacterized protein n=1 Tax=Limosilactobacillus balticus TaxID=2759747 RepID=A0ABS8RDZ8_9LACO|nr:hypothetical protein [Limosilactobacillus balticus]MCD7138933.1 hypothetical protein [Limosilactobacillus balticus]